MFFKDLVQPWRKPLRRYYIKSLIPCALTLLIFFIGVNAPLAPWQKLTWVLLVMLPFLWSSLASLIRWHSPPDRQGRQPTRSVRLPPGRDLRRHGQ